MIPETTWEVGEESPGKWVTLDTHPDPWRSSPPLLSSSSFHCVLLMLLVFSGGKNDSIALLMAAFKYYFNCSCSWGTMG